MKDKDTEFWSEGEDSGKENSDYLKETSPLDYYSKRLVNAENKCICPNQELVTNDNFCEMCNSYIE